VFCLAAALAYLDFDRTRKASRYWLALGLFVLALLAKTVTATLPAALLVVFRWRRGRLDWRRDARPLVPWFALSAAAACLTEWVERRFIGAEGGDFALTIAQRFLLACRAIWFYLGKLAWPANLAFTYPHWTIDPAQGWQYLFPIGLLALAVGLGLLARRHRGPLAGFLIFCGTLFPALGFLDVYPFRYSYVADHFQYLASLGIIVPATSGLMLALARISPAKTPAIVCPALLLAVLGVSTWRQSGIYRDSETLYRETLARNPTSWMAHNNLGIALWQVPGKLPEAIAEYQAALGIKPDYLEAHYNLGNALAEMPDRLPEAIGEYQAALRLRPHYAEAHYNLGSALARSGRLPEAIAEYRAALRIKPDLAEAHNDLGSALSATPGRLPEAVAEYQAALRIEPGLAEAHVNLGNALAQTPGRLPEAIAEYQAALRINPDLAEAHFNLGNALSQIPARVPEAIAEYREALRIRPDLEGARRSIEELRALEQ